MTDKIKEVLRNFYNEKVVAVNVENYEEADKALRKAAHQLNQMLIEAKEDGVKFARLKIEELASKEMRDGRHRYSDEIETILEALKAEKEEL